ncbi:MAG TPA: ATP-binding protein [Streptosporangiaceae bacterium]
MPERDHGPRAVATLLTAPTQQLDRPAHDRDLLRSRAGQFLESRKRDPANNWPLRSYLQLGALPGAVPCARLHAKLVLWEWGLDRLVETSELLVSEIVTNAVRASAGPASSRGDEQQASGLPSVWLWLATDRRDVLIQVWDGNNEIPARQDMGPEAEGGRGLLLVERLSAQWGSYTPEGWSGKVVWAIVGEDAAGRADLTASA